MLLSKLLSTGRILRSCSSWAGPRALPISAAIASNLPIFEYAPRKVKMAVTGQGGASKEQVALILSRTLGVELQPGFLDATDALAIAMCHFYQLVNPLADTDSSTDWKKFIKSHPDRVK